MEFKNNLISSIIEAQNIIENYIQKTEEQKGNDTLLYTFRDALKELIYKIEYNKKIDNNFISKWKIALSSACRSFEGLPLLELLYFINSMLNSSSAKSSNKN